MRRGDGIASIRPGTFWSAAGLRAICLLLSLALLSFVPADLAHHLHDQDCGRDASDSGHSCLVCSAFHHAASSWHGEAPAAPPPRVTNLAPTLEPRLSRLEARVAVVATRGPPPLSK